MLSVSVNDFYSFGVENGDTSGETGSSAQAKLIFSNFTITNLLKNENDNATFATVC